MTTPANALTGPNRDAYVALTEQFKKFGLESLAGKIYDYVKQGYGADVIALLLQDTAEYKQRFAGNEARRKAGLAVLAPSEYLATEASYRQIMEAAGMPKGYYDQPTDFAAWIGAGVSPQEIKFRVDAAAERVSQTDPYELRIIKQIYGVNESDIVAYFLDRKRAEPVLKKQMSASAIGAAALRRGFNLNRIDLESYADLGISGQDAEAAYARIADSFEAMSGLANVYGASWTQKDAEREVFMPGAAPSVGAESAFEKGKRLRSQERAAFAGGRGSSSQGLNAGYRRT